MGAGHREIDHTADLGFELWADSVEELYSEGIRALAELCFEPGTVRPTQRRPLRAVGATSEERMVRWLQEAYLQLESDLWLAADAVDVGCDGDAVSGTLVGEPYDPGRHTLHTEIKAITYHGMEIGRSGDLWRTQVIVDV